MEKLKEETTETPIHMLDNDSLIEIFMYLPLHKRLELEQVCTRWRDLVSENAWHDITELDCSDPKTIEIDFGRKIPKQSAFETLLIRCGRYLKNLNIPSTYDPEIIKIVRDHCHHLTKIKFELGTNSKYPVDLSNLDDRLSIDDNIPLRDDSFDYFESLRLELQDIRLKLCAPSEIDYSRENIDNRPHGPPPKSDYFFSFEKDGIGQNKKKEEDNLIHLDLATDVIDEKKTLSSLINLDYLNSLLSSPDGKDDLLVGLIRNCRDLKHLDISHSRLSKRGIIELATLEDLEILVMNDVSNEPNSIGIPLGPFPKLKRLECHSNFGVTDKSIIPVLDSSPDLELLDLALTQITKQTLLHAINITKERKNDIVLHIRYNNWFLADFDMESNTSPFLVIETN